MTRLPSIGFGMRSYLKIAGGRSQLLVRLDDNETGIILPVAVSNDGKWALWTAEPPLNEPARRAVGVSSLRAVLVNVDTRDQQLLLNESPDISGYVSYLWFGER
jgi:hypothetical protein